MQKHAFQSTNSNNLTESLCKQANLPSLLLSNDFNEEEVEEETNEGGQKRDDDDEASGSDDVEVTIDPVTIKLILTNPTIRKNSIVLWINWIVATLGECPSYRPSKY